LTKKAGGRLLNNKRSSRRHFGNDYYVIYYMCKYRCYKQALERQIRTTREISRAAGLGNRLCENEIPASV